MRKYSRLPHPYLANPAQSSGRFVVPDILNKDADGTWTCWEYHKVNLDFDTNILTKEVTQVHTKSSKLRLWTFFCSRGSTCEESRRGARQVLAKRSHCLTAQSYLPALLVQQSLHPPEQLLAEVGKVPSGAGARQWKVEGRLGLGISGWELKEQGGQVYDVCFLAKLWAFLFCKYSTILG